MELDAGEIESFSYDLQTKEVQVTVGSGPIAVSGEPLITMKWEQTVKDAGGCEMALQSPQLERRLDGWKVQAPQTLTFCAK